MDAFGPRSMIVACAVGVAMYAALSGVAAVAGLWTAPSVTIRPTLRAPLSSVTASTPFGRTSTLSPIARVTPHMAPAYPESPAVQQPVSGLPLAVFAAAIISVALAGRRVVGRSLAVAATTGGEESPALRDLREQVEVVKGKLGEAKNQALKSQGEWMETMRGKMDSAKEQLDTARTQVESLKAQMQGAKEEMVPKLRAELDRARATMDAAQGRLRATSAELAKILADDSPLPEEQKVGWLMQNAIGLGGLVAQLWLSAVSTVVGLIAVQLLSATKAAGGWGMLIFATISIGASWASVYWCYQSHLLGKRLLGDSSDPVPAKGVVLRQLWTGLSVNAYGLLAALVGVQVNTGTLFLDAMAAGIVAPTPSPAAALTKGISAFEIFVQLAQSQALLSLSVGLLLALITLRVASRPEAEETPAAA